MSTPVNKRNQELGQMPIGPLLLKLSLPATIGMVVNALYNLVDAIFIGLGVSADALGGLTIAFPLQMLLMSIALMVGIGAGSVVSIHLGKKEYSKVNRVAGNAFLLIVAISILLVISGLIFLDPILRFFGANVAPQLLPYARSYMSIILLGSVFFNFAVTSNNLIRAEGNAKVAMLAMVIGTGLNIVLDPIFIFGFKMGIEGAAIATILSQFVSFCYVVIYFISGKSNIKMGFRYWAPERQSIISILSVGFPTFMRHMAASVVAVVVNNSLGKYGGKEAINAFGAIHRVMAFLFMPIFGVVQGMQPIVGFNFGAKQYDRVVKAVFLAGTVITIFASLGWLLSLVFATPLMHLFVRETEVITIGSKAIRIVFLMLPIVGIQIVAAVYFQSVSKTKPALILSMLRQVLFLIPLVLILPRLNNLGLMGVLIAYPISDFFSTAISAYMLKKEITHLNQKHKKISTQKEPAIVPP
jgi:MATE family, multidrug efflux pump